MKKNKRQKNVPCFSRKLSESLQEVHDFLDAFPGKDLKHKAWELTTAAFGSEEADGWSHIQRSDMLYFYTKLKKLAHALIMIDKKLYRKSKD